MKNQEKRVLFFSEAVTLAHVARCINLIENISQLSRYNIFLAADSRYDDLLGEIKCQRIFLFSISGKEFNRKLKSGLPIYNNNILTQYINEDLKVIDEVKPDFIIGDFRLSLAVSCRLRMIPYATITNAYWSPYAEIDYPLPELPVTKVLGITLAQKIFNCVRPLAFKLHTIAFNKVCKKFGHPGVVNDLRELYTQADYTLYADTESLVPMRPLPANHFFIGPVLWSASVPLPDWWDGIPDEHPVIFITLGSSGDSRLLPLLLQTLNELSVTIICATVKNFVWEKSHPNIFLAKFLPAEIAVKKADIVICNGGSPMVYQSLVEGKPVIGFPSNLDQFLMMNLVVKSGYGELIRPSEASPGKIISAVNRALSKRNKPMPFANCSLDITKIIQLIELATSQS